MSVSARAVVFFLTVAASIIAAPNQYVARYLSIGTSGSAAALAEDATGNLFIVAGVEEPSGAQEIRAIKTAPRGKQIASFGLGGVPASDKVAPSGAAVDPQGNLVIVGSNSPLDFPLVSP